MGFREHWERWAPLVISVAVLLGLGFFALSLVRSSNVAAEEAVGEGAISKQRTVAALTDQYLQLAAKEAFDLDVAAPLELTEDSTADAAALQSLLSRQGGFFDHAARLTDLGGDTLTGVGGEVPPPHTEAYRPLKASLIRNEPGVSSLMWVDDVPLVAVGVPVLRDEIPEALLLAYFRADTSMLQRYSEKLGDGEGVGMIVDSDGTIVAARHADLVGTRLDDRPSLQQVVSDPSGHATFERDGTPMVGTWAPIETGGWTLVEEEPAETFYASVHRQSSTARVALIGLILGAAVLAAVLNQRVHRARRGGAQRAQALVRDANDVITIVDADGTITYASPATTEVLGFHTSEFVGRAAREFVHPDDLSCLQAAVESASRPRVARQRIQARILRANGTYCPCELVVSDQSQDRTVRGTIVSMRDITELVALHDKLSYQALHDPLTELPNRTQLERHMREAINTCDGTTRVAALFLDLDGFKAVNDELGHDRGDELLVQVAGRLRSCVREGDTVARLGGDEFVIVLRSDEPELNAVRVASRTLELLAEPFHVSGHPVFVGASIGIALGDVAVEPDTLLREADAAMYLAKDRGRLRYEFPSAGLAGTGASGGRWSSADDMPTAGGV